MGRRMVVHYHDLYFAAARTRRRQDLPDQPGRIHPAAQSFVSQEAAFMKKLLVLLMLAGAAVLAWATWSYYFRSSGSAEESFTLAPVKFGALTETVSATGLLQPHQMVVVGSEQSG